MDFPSLEWVAALKEKCNGDPDFNTATKWSDVKVVLGFGDQRYWLNLYKGKKIDLMEYLPMTNALGYDILVNGSVDAWKSVIKREMVFAAAAGAGAIAIDGNMLECNRMYEAICLIGDLAPEVN